MKRKHAHDSFFDFDLDHKHLHFRRTKIIATIGPATSSPSALRALIAKGLDVIRINFSHGDPEEHVRTMRRIRKIARTLKKEVTILGDLCGPKIRVGEFRKEPVQLKEHTVVTITTKPMVGDERLIVSQYEGLVREVDVGHRILLDDGALELEVTKKTGRDSVEARVLRGGPLKSHKGMNLPNTRLKVPALTEKDRQDVLHCIRGGVDYLALSFVRKAKDILDLREHLKKNNASFPIIAKIEKPEALDDIKRIVELADGIMVARGDLGVELPETKVPLIQSKLIRITNRCNKPVIVATQMLESMVEHSRPTRAEVADVAGACRAGVDAVMLSGETAVGKYPVETFEMMDSILRETEAYQYFTLGGRFIEGEESGRTAAETNLQDALGEATAQLSRDLAAKSIFVLTRSGYTARMVSSDRPSAPIIALTQSERVLRQINLLWGVYPHLTRKALPVREYLKEGEAILKRLKLARKGEYAIMLWGMGDRPQSTNSLVVHEIE
jgi:pyruvate kinase